MLESSGAWLGYEGIPFGNTWQLVMTCEEYMSTHWGIISSSRPSRFHSLRAVHWAQVFRVAAWWIRLILTAKAQEDVCGSYTILQVAWWGLISMHSALRKRVLDIKLPYKLSRVHHWPLLKVRVWLGSSLTPGKTHCLILSFCFYCVFRNVFLPKTEALLWSQFHRLGQ